MAVDLTSGEALFRRWATLGRSNSRRRQLSVRGTADPGEWVAMVASAAAVAVASLLMVVCATVATAAQQARGVLAAGRAGEIAAGGADTTPTGNTLNFTNCAKDVSKCQNVKMKKFH
jgi:hypothetical protein